MTNTYPHSKIKLYYKLYKLEASNFIPISKLVLSNRRVYRIKWSSTKLVVWYGKSGSRNKKARRVEEESGLNACNRASHPGVSYAGRYSTFFNWPRQVEKVSLSPRVPYLDGRLIMRSNHKRQSPVSNPRARARLYVLLRPGTF